MKYVLGFYFDIEDRVLLMRRGDPTHPNDGLLNGLGGKIESGETPHDAMVREFHEEAGVVVPEWRPFCCLVGPNYTVYCFESRGFATYDQRSINEGVLRWYSQGGALGSRMPNLDWLIALAQDRSVACSEVHY